MEQTMVDLIERNKQHTYTVPKGNLSVTPIEMEVLTYLYRHRTLRNQDMYRILKAKGSYLSKSSFENKLFRTFLDKELVGRYRYRYHNSNEEGQRGPTLFNMWYLKPAGVNFLIENGYLPRTIDPYSSARVSDLSNKEHHILVQDTVCKAFAYALDSGIDVKHFSPWTPDYHSLFDGTNVRIRPDWCFTLKDKIINLEADMGTETLPSIRNKVEAYTDLANDFPNYRHIVLFYLADNHSVRKNLYSHHKRRIWNIKDKLIEMEKGMPSNLEVYVIQHKHVDLFMQKLFTGVLPAEPSSFSEVADTFTQLSSEFDFPYTITHEDIHDFVKQLPSGAENWIGSYQLIHDDGLDYQNAIICYLEQGNVRQLARFHYLYDLLNNKGFGRVVHNLIGVYPNNTDMHKDILDMYFDKVYITSASDLNPLEGGPHFYLMSVFDTLLEVEYGKLNS